ncbi:MAG: hypothetical protein WEB60_12045 [Terrimicrobiaceae bacterium]
MIDIDPMILLVIVLGTRTAAIPMSIRLSAKDEPSDHLTAH